MATKEIPGRFDCYAAAKPDEELFILLGRDRHAAVLVNLWATMRDIDGDDPVKVAEAFDCANRMVEQIQARGHTPAGIATVATALAVLAEACGCVVRIEPRPLQPLRMGNYAQCVEVYPRYSPGPQA